MNLNHSDGGLFLGWGSVRGPGRFRFRPPPPPFFFSDAWLLQFFPLSRDEDFDRCVPSGGRQPRRSENWHNICCAFMLLAGSFRTAHFFSGVRYFWLSAACCTQVLGAPPLTAALRRKQSTTRYHVRRKGDSYAPTVNSVRSKDLYHYGRIQ